MPVETAGKVIDAMRASPLAIALLAVNVAFLIFAAYLLGEVAESSRERNKAQLEMVTSMVKELVNCHQDKGG
jgi:hypothetical protein